MHTNIEATIKYLAEQSGNGVVLVYHGKGWILYGVGGLVDGKSLEEVLFKAQELVGEEK